MSTYHRCDCTNYAFDFWPFPYLCSVNVFHPDAANIKQVTKNVAMYVGRLGHSQGKDTVVSRRCLTT
jgi:hypothetical protein